MNLKTWVLAGAAVLVAVTATGGGVVVSGAKQAAPAAQEPPAHTAKVEKGKLSAMVSMDGTLTYRARSDGSPYSVINQPRGTYTELPDDGHKVDCGDVLYRVDDFPVLLLCGTVPAYRDLHTGDAGEDVRQLNRNLWKLGYAAAAGVDIDPDDSAFTWKTEKALEVLRHDKGFGVTGQLDLAVGHVVSTVSATGNVAAPAQARLNFKSGGLLAQLLVHVGDQVAEGQPLAKLDDTDLRVALTQAQASYNSAAARLELTRAGSRPEDIAAAQSQVDQARTRLAQAQANLDAATLTAPFAGVVAATGVNPGEQLRSSGEGAAVITLVNPRQVRMDDAVFLPGSVRIARVTGELGGPAQPGVPVLYATSDTLEVQVDLEASQRGEVKVGDPARITLPGNNSVTGKVDRLGRVAQVPAGQYANASARQHVGAATIPAFLSLDDPVKASGLDKAPVQVEITTRGVESALSVPVTALVGKSGGGFAVEVVRAGGRRELVAVKLGLFDTAGGRVQVEGELGEGDRVVVPSP